MNSPGNCIIARMTMTAITISSSIRVRPGALAFKFFHAVPADAGAVAQIVRHAGEERFGDFQVRAPARALVGRDGAEPAIVGLVAQGTLAGVE